MQQIKYMKKLKTGITALLLIIVLQSCDNEESDIQTEIKIPVSVVSIKPQSISKFIETTGTVYSSKEAIMKSELSGIYKLQVNPATQKSFALGDVVKSGQVLIRIQDDEFVRLLSRVFRHDRRGRIPEWVTDQIFLTIWSLH